MGATMNDDRALGEVRDETALVGARLRALREDPIEGLSRRTLLRRSLGLGVALWLAEVGVESIGFLWNAVGRQTARICIGTLDDIADVNPALPFRDGFPMYVQSAR